MDSTEILKKYCNEKYGNEVVIKTYTIQEIKQIIDFTKQLMLGVVMHWVAFSETKPETGQWLLVSAPTGRHIAWYNGFQFEDRAGYNIENVTHWMQIPEPPYA